MLLISGDGRPTEFLLPLASAHDDNNWKLISIPVAAIPGISAGNAQIKEVDIFGDSPTPMYLGKISVVVDETPIRVDPIEEIVVPRNDRRRYTVRATGGSTPLKYSWDWDSSDGLQEEGVGRSVTHAYVRAGDYMATVTVSDLYGLKPPVKMNFKVHVTP
jgi:hypothetical protein